MENELVNLRELNEERPLDWRWLRALQLESRNTRIKELEDPEVTHIRKFLRDLSSGIDSEVLCTKHPVLFEVHRIYNSASTTRWTLEALVMANVPPIEICAKFGWSTKTGIKLIKTYENCKFDIRSRLKYEAYVMSNVLGTISNSMNNVQPAEEKIWKLLAWIGYRKNYGTSLLDGFINLDNMPDDVKVWYDKFITNQFTRRTVRGLIKFDPIYMPQMVDMLKLHNDNKRLEMEQHANGISTGTSELESAQRDLINSLETTVLEVNKVRVSAIEPRASQVFNDEIELALTKQVQDALSNRPLLEEKPKDE